jgi:hypothetical protein
MDGYGSAAASHTHSSSCVYRLDPHTAAIRVPFRVMDRWRTGEGALARRAPVHSPIRGQLLATDGCGIPLIRS